MSFPPLHERLKETSVTEGIAGVTAVGILESVLFNAGFFGEEQISLISLLTVQDIVLGAVHAILLISVIVGLYVGIHIYNKHIFGGSLRSTTLFFSALCIIVAIFVFVADPTNKNTTIVALGLCAIFSLIVFLRRSQVIALIFAVLVPGPFFLGISAYADITSQDKVAIELEMVNGDHVTARPLRVTKSFYFVIIDEDMAVFPVDEVKMYLISREQ